MSKQSVYTVHSGDECGGDPCYNVLKGPAGFECWLTEPEDRSFWRDLAPVVERLEHLEQSNAQLREQNRVLASLLAKAQPHVCSMLCPSVKREGDPWTHKDLCTHITAALTATSQGDMGIETVTYDCGTSASGPNIARACPVHANCFSRS